MGLPVNVSCKSFQSCLTLCDPMNCSPPGSSVHGIFQARILEWVAPSFPRGSSWPRDWTCVFCTAGRFFTIWATMESPIKSQGWWKGKVALLQRPATRGLGRLLSTSQLPHHWQSVGKSFYRQSEGATCKNSTVSSESHLGIGRAVVWSESSWLF